MNKLFVTVIIKKRKAKHKVHTDSLIFFFRIEVFRFFRYWSLVGDPSIVLEARLFVAALPMWRVSGRNSLEDPLTHKV